MPATGFVSIQVFPRYGENEHIVAAIEIHQFELDVVSALLGLDPFDFVAGGERDVEAPELLAYFSQRHGVAFDLERFSYQIAVRSRTGARVNRENYRRMLG